MSLTRLDRLLLRIPRLRNLVLDREAFAAHTFRLQKELNESHAREAALRLEVEETAREAAARERARSAGLAAQDRMRAEWDARARTGAAYFIATANEQWSDDEFFASGEANIREHVLTDMENICGGRDPKQMRIIEIGCGAGRLTRALAGIFGEVHAVDISPEMIRLAREKLAGVKNVRLYCNSGADLAVLPQGPYDFAFSYIVFQHVPERQIVENYVHDVARVLAPGSLFKFQVEGAGGRERGDTWHGVSFSEPEMRAMADRNGFEMRYAEGAGTQYFWLWFFKPADAPGPCR